MREWKPLDWISYSVFWVAAIVLAADAGLKSSPSLMEGLDFLHSKWWGFAPLVLLAIATVGLVARAFGWHSSSKMKLTKVSSVIYKREVVEIDGKLFSECQFHEVTFKYLGGNFQFHKCQIVGNRYVEIHPFAARGAVELLKQCRFLEPEFSKSVVQLSEAYLENVNPRG